MGYELETPDRVDTDYETPAPIRHDLSRPLNGPPPLTEDDLATVRKTRQLQQRRAWKRK
jgi:hypothetical protein